MINVTLPPTALNTISGTPIFRNQLLSSGDFVSTVGKSVVTCWVGDGVEVEAIHIVSANFGNTPLRPGLENVHPTT